MKYLIIELNTNKCETIYGKKCDYELGKERCNNCAEVYEGESQHVIDELVMVGYEVWDIAECNYQYDKYDHFRHWWVKVDGIKTKQPDLVIL